MREFFQTISQWIAPTACAIAVYFLTRFVKRHDQFKDSVDQKLDQHAKKVEDSAEHMETTAGAIQKEALEIKKAMLNFKGKVNDELLGIHRKAILIEASMERTNEKATAIQENFNQVNLKVDQFCSHIDEVQKTVEAHHKSLSLGAKAIHQHREEILNMKTEIRRINENLVIISEKKREPQGGSGDGKS